MIHRAPMTKKEMLDNIDIDGHSKRKRKFRTYAKSKMASNS